MPLYYLLLLAIIQGITEFLPVSSSGHLAVLPAITGIQDQGQSIDVWVHIGTLGAVILYFWSDVRQAFFGLFRLLHGKVDTDGARLALLLIIATLPVVIIGFILKVTGWVDLLRSIKVIGWAMLIFAIVLYWADKTGNTQKNESHWNIKDALKMGLWQAVALIPGTSRSGITITAARQMGYNRKDSAKISMLMSIPTIIAAAILLGADTISNADWQSSKDGLIAAIFSFGAALLALSLMMRILETVSFTPYVIYRIIFGLILLFYAYT